MRELTLLLRDIILWGASEKLVWTIKFIAV